VSIKNKLVTAVTTAGLLAGLFGSAFVPAARAAASSTAAFTAGGSNEQYDDATNDIMYVSAADFPVFQATVTATNAGNDDDGLYTAAVSGANIRACVAANVSITAATLSVVGLSECTVFVDNDAGGGDATITLTLGKLAAGSTATVTLSDPDGDELLAYTIEGVASTAGASAVDADESQDTVTVNYDSGDGAGLALDVPDEVISSVDYFLPTNNAGKDPVWTGVVSNQFGTAAGGGAAVALIAELDNETFAIGCDAAVNGTAASSTTYVTTFNSSAAGVWECEIYADSATSSGGAFEVTVKALVSGKVVGIFDGAFYGKVTTLTASFVDGDRVPADAGAEVDDYILVGAKDGNGKAYGLAEVNALVLTSYGTVAGGTTAGAQSLTDGTSAAAKNYFKVDVDYCPTGSAGKTATMQASTTVSGTAVRSNTLTIACGADKDDALTIQKIEFETDAPLPGEAFDVYVYFEDADGILGGAADGLADYGLILTGATEEEANWNGTTVDATAAGGAFNELIDGYGKMIFTIKAPATVGTTITVSDPNSSAIAKVYTTNDAYEGVLTVGPKKLKATADFGPAAAKKKIAFVLESASGTTKTYYRRANASGVATYTLVLRGTWTVYATFGDEISDTGTMRR
jgi:hypothetical protein